MKIYVVFMMVLFLLCSCSTDKKQINKKYRSISPATCSSNNNSAVTIDELEELTSANAHQYTISGTCRRDNAEIEIKIENHPLNKKPTCNRKKWKITLDATAIINKKNRIQIKASQAGSRDLFCKNIPNYFICPNNYIGVPKLKRLSRRSFCVMKFEAKTTKSIEFSDYNRPIIKAESLAKGKLIQNINEEDAIKYCKENGAGYNLINNDEWQTIAIHIELEEINWSNGTKRAGQYNRLNVGNTTVIESSNNTNSISDKTWSLNKRTHKLQNGAYIWDFAGNVAEIVILNDNIPSQYKNNSGYIYNIPSGLKKLFGSNRDYSILETQDTSRSYGGLGYFKIKTHEGAVLRGGTNPRDAGIFSAFVTHKRNSHNGAGFRCVYHP